MITKQQVEGLIERLIPDNELCNLGTDRCDVCKLQPIYIGDVLDKMQNIACEHEDDELFSTHCADLCLLWEKCDFRKSLQEIVEASWYHSLMDSEDKEVQKELVSLEASALFSYLLHLFPENNE